MIEKIIKKHKALSLFIIVIILFFTFMNIDHALEIKRLKSQYEADMEKLRDMIPEAANNTQRDINDKSCDESIIEWLTYYYGVSEDVTREFRDQQLSDLMTSEAYLDSEKEYEIDLGYKSQITDIQIFYYPLSDTEKDICIFFEKNIIWPQIDPLVSRWYMTGHVILEDGIWKIEEIKQCEEMITREEYNMLQPDTNGSELDEAAVSGEESGVK